MFNKNEWQRNYRADKLRRGLCGYGACNQPSKPGCKGCEIHCSVKRRQELAKRMASSYRPPSTLLSLSAFCNLPVDVLAYAAALMEGEGAFVLFSTNTNGRKPQALLSMKMTDEEPIRWMHATFGGRVCENAAYGTRKKTWSWKVSGRLAGAVCAAIYRYMKAKRRKEQATAVIRVASLCGWFRKCSVDERGLRIIKRLQEFYVERRRKTAA